MKKQLVSLAVLAMGMSFCFLPQGQTVNSLKMFNAATSGANRYYYSDYDSKEKALEAGLEVNKKIAEEGMVLVKNKNDALPLVTGKGTSGGKVTLFGYRATVPQGGADSSGDTSGGKVKLTADIYSSLEDSGYIVNPVVKEEYATQIAAKKTNDIDLYNAMFGDATVKAKLESSYSTYNDAAIVVLSAGTGAYVSTGSVVATRNHKLQLDGEQIKLVKEATDNFDKVIVLINDSTPLELGELQANEKVDAIMIIGQPGDNGFEAVGKLLSGEVNPSGHLADTYAADFTKDPSYNNINTTGDAVEGNPRYWIDANGNGTKDDGESKDSYFCDYDEGIYVGYRYWETAYAEAQAGNYDGFDYITAVTYPFGYGLSYTTFEWTLQSSPEASQFAVGNTLNFYVKVKNIGNYAGKDVVQLYYHAPYTDYDKNNKVEKSEVVLGDFAKTKTLQPGESQVLKLSVDVNDMASYDYTTAKTYVLDAGDYKISFRTDSHTVKSGVTDTTYTLETQTNVNTAVTGEEITNAYEEMTDTAATVHGVGTFSRSDFTNTFPQVETEAEGKLTQAQYDALAYDVKDTSTDPWYTTTMPSYMTAADRASKPVADVVLADFVGKDYEDPLWDSLLDELTLDEMNDLITNAGFRTQAIDYIGKPYSLDTDGPKGWTGTGTAGTKYNAFASEPVIAATFSKELAYEMGKVVGDQGIWGCSDRTDIDAGGKVYGYTGWYAPGMNMHRSPFEGRITEYFSEDPILTGQMVANQSLGIKSKGGFVFIKHFAVHEDGGGVGISITETGYKIAGYRGTSDAHSGTCYWLTEQALREFYLKPFQIAVEDGEAGACMSSFSRIGYTWAGGDYSLLTTLLRDEWGFKGYVVTDIAIYGFLNVDQMLRAGGDCLLTSNINSNYAYCGNASYSSDGSNALTKPTEVAAMRQASKNILYTVANSHAMDVPMGAKVIDPEVNVTEATVGTSYSLDFKTEVNTKYVYSDISYSISGDVPAGLTLNEKTGVLSGTPTKAGKYVFTVTASADGYESSNTTVTLNINEAAKTDDTEKTIKDLQDKITELEGQVDADKEKISALEGKSNAGILAMSIIAVVLSVISLGLLVAGFFLLKKKNK